MLLILVLLFTLLAFVVAGLWWVVARLAGVRISMRSVLRRGSIVYLPALPIFVWIVLPLALSSWISSADTRPQDRLLNQSPLDFGRSYEEIELTTRDSVRVSGWFLRGSAEKPALVVGHGLFRNRQEVVERACSFNRIGYPVLLFDFRNHGTSGKKRITLGYQERYDFEAALRYLAESGHDRVFLLGVSMGAVAAIQAASESPPNLVAVIADSPFLNLRETVARHTRLFMSLPAFPFADLFVWNLSRIGSFRPEELDTERALRQRVKVPILLIAGGRDERMPLDSIGELFQAASNSTKELLVFKEAGHGAAWKSEPHRYLTEINDWIQKQSPSLGVNATEK